MPEEKKKESFTFSDKIKDSKSNKAASKSFAKRISSRIGRDGKPRQTIFERTKRDAPFLIAALIALLLLPFLYKYSGSVKEETVLTPSSTETVFDPERYAFAPDIEDPEGQISQLSGRDSLSLIKGFGSDSEEDEYGSSDDYDYKAEAYAQRDAYKESASAKKLKADTNIDIEENTTNIYKKRARAGTRAAFKRAATKINTLPGGSKARTSGSPLGVGKWGGSLKGAAKKVKGDGNKNSPKPVSLQPLQAAGKPSRSAFGNPAAALRQSKDALGKGDAKQAILDAQMKPVEPGSFGGMTLGDAKFGGGSGNFDRKFNYQGKEPWWWDLMKTRSQALWQRKMQRKWNWEDWLDKWAQNILGKLMNCLVTGSDEGDVDGFLYKKEGDGKEALCCGYKRKVAEPHLKRLGVEWGKDGCKSLQVELGKDKCKEAWEDAKEAKADMNFFQVRGACLGLAVGSKYGKGEPSLSVDCSDLDIGHNYVITHNGKARKWQKNTYVYVVARNYVPFPYELMDRNAHPKMAQEKERGGMRLCSVFGNNLRATDKSAAGVAAIYTTTTEMLAEKYDLSGKDKAKLREMERAAHVETNDLTIHDDIYMGERSPQMPKRLYEEMEDYAVAHAGSIYKSANASWARAEEYDPESLNDACVIYQAKAVSWDWEKHFKPQVISLLVQLLKDRELAKGMEYKIAVDMFNGLDLMFVGAMSSEHQFAQHRDVLDSEMLPMPFWEFKAAYLDRYGVTAKHKDSGKRSYIGNAKYRTEGEDTVYSEKCYFHNSVGISCYENHQPITATVTFKGDSYKGGQAGVYYASGLGAMKKDVNFTEEKKNIRVTAEFTPLDGSYSGVVQKFNDPQLIMEDRGAQLVYTLRNDILGIQQKSEKERVVSTQKAEDFRGRVTWKLFRGSNPEAIDSATCDIGTAGDTYSSGVDDECSEPGSEDRNPKCCEKLGRVFVDGRCQEKNNIPSCKPGDEQKTQRCCKELMGPDYLWRESPDPKCYKPEGEPEDSNLRRRPNPDDNASGETRLAPVIKWVSKEPTNRKPVDPSKEPGKDVFGNDLVQPAQNDGAPYQHCGIEDTLVMNSDAAAKYIRTVVSAYNKCYAEDIASGRKPRLSDKFKNGADYPNDAEYIDALNIADGLSKNCPSLNGLTGEEKHAFTKTPGAATCELGRDMVRMSQDKHVGKKKVPGKNYNFRNDLGAFLAYVHPASILYPAKYHWGVCDERFQGRDVNESGCGKVAAKNNVPNAYHHNNYNNNPHPNIYAGYYEPSLVKEQIYSEDKGFLLAELVDENNATSASRNCAALNSKYATCGKCANEVNEYNSDSGCALLYRDVNEQTGQACVAFAGEKEVTVSKVLDYVQAVCKAGLYRKPWGITRQGGDENSFGSPRNRGLGGSSTSDRGVGTNPTKD